MVLLAWHKAGLSVQPSIQAPTAPALWHATCTILWLPWPTATTVPRRPFCAAPPGAAAMVGESWLASHFEVVGDRSKHFGPFAGRGSAAPPAEHVAAGAAMELGLGSCCG